MKILRDEWVIIFNETKHIIPSDTSVAIIFSDSKTIINDNLIYSNYIATLLYYFYCVVEVFTKYRLLFELSECHFFLPRI